MAHDRPAPRFGGTMIVRNLKHGRRNVKAYGCSSYHQRGRSICENSLVEAMDKVDRAVLATFERQLLNPAMVDDIVAAALARLKPARAGLQNGGVALAQGLDRVEAEIRNLTAAVAAGGELASLLGALKEREADRQRLRRQLASAEHAERKTVTTPSKLREQLEEKNRGLEGRPVPSGTDVPADREEAAGRTSPVHAETTRMERRTTSSKAKGRWPKC